VGARRSFTSLERQKAVPAEPFARRIAMKRIPIGGVLVFLVAGYAEAQKVDFGVKGGLSSATLNTIGDTSGVDLGHRQGFTVGGFVSFPLNGVLSLQPEVMYVPKGVPITRTDSSETVTMRLSYLELPVLLRVAPRVRGPVRFDVFGGPAFSARLSARVRVEGAGSSNEGDIKDDVKSSEVGVAFGGAVYFGRLLAEARYTMGLTSVAVDSAGMTETPKNRVFGFLFGVRF
jgi:hypothetical protein